MKVEVQKREKKREKERAIRRAMEVLVQAGIDLMRRIMAEMDIPKKRTIMDEIDALRIYINELLAKIHDRLKLSVPQYRSDWSTSYPFSPSVKKAEKAKEEAKRLRELRETESARINAEARVREGETPTPAPI
jgi:ribosomal protein L20